jgi:glycolate oxidase FAD binding subunit
METCNVLPDLKPALEADLARIVINAAAEGKTLDVLGAGSKRDLGRPVQGDTKVSMRALSGVVLYEPNEMVMSARAGTRLVDIEAQLAGRGQMLAFEPSDFASLTGGTPGQATIGGVFATNTSGPRRVIAGAARDHFIGVRAVTGKGEIIKSGGRVMKNVTGVDVCRGLANSWGTLAVMSEVTFKVLPMPESTSTLVLLGLPDEIAVEALCAAMNTPFEVSATAHIQSSLATALQHAGLRSQGRSITAIRLENTPKSIVYRRDKLVDALKAYGDIHELDRDNSVSFWGEMRALGVFQGGSGPVWRISTAPTSGAKVVAAVSKYMDCKAIYDWSGGLVYAEVLATSDAGAADVRRVVATFGGHATLMRAAPEVRASVEVFQPLNTGMDKIARKLKSIFDPSGVLNPGRMYAHM